MDLTNYDAIFNPYRGDRKNKDQEGYEIMWNKKGKGKYNVFLAILLTTAMMVFSACGTASDSKSASEGKSGETADSDQSQTQSTADLSDTDALNKRNEDGSYDGPLCEDEHTFTAFIAGSGNFTTGTFSEEVIKNNPAYQRITENTNVKIDFIVPASGEEESQFNLLIASGNYPDIIIGSASVTYPGGFDQAIDDGCFLDLTSYAEEYMPNYLAAISANEQVYKEATTLQNRIPCAFYLYNPEYEGKELQWWGQAIRKDILDELNLEIPETVEEWESVLRAMKDYGIEVPYSMVNCTGMDQAFLAAFGIAKAPIDWQNNIGFYADESGKITYGAIEEGYKEYLTMMNRWYKEGLLDSEFMTRSWRTVADTIYAMYGSGQIGAVYSLDGILPTMVQALGSQNPDGETVAVGVPKKDENSISKVSIGKLYAGGGTWWAITSKCSDPKLAMNFLDYLCTEDGINLTNYGVEDISYTMVNGVPTYTDVVLEAETGSSDGWRRNSGLALCIIGQEKVRNAQFKDASIQEWDRIWTETANQYSTVWSLTSEEELSVSSIMNDISTYVQEQTIKAIIDDTALNNWDKTVETIYSMKLEEALDIYQAGYDRYNNR